jgi:hypothetical protein
MMAKQNIRIISLHRTVSDLNLPKLRILIGKIYQGLIFGRSRKIFILSL